MVFAARNHAILNNCFVQLKRVLGRKNFTMSVESQASEIVGNDSKGSKRVAEDDGDAVNKIQKTERIKKKNYVMLLSYLGRDFHGMQINRGTRTIEEELINALSKANAVTQEALEDLHVIHFQRAARTDKGVSALRQIVNLLLPDNVDKSAINQHLPEEIRVFALKRVTRGFNSKNQCDARTYKYIIPTFAFAPEDPNVLKTPDTVDVDERIQQLAVINGKPYTEFRLPDESQERLSSVLKIFEGTHKYHNYTSKMQALNPAARRYIMHFNCTDIFESQGLEFAVLEVKGQSFMLHQIRKMVAVVVAVLRNIITEETVQNIFDPKKYDIPIAPGLGLYLNYVHYDRYNKRYGADGVHEKLEWKEYDEEIKEFQKNYILKHIVETEISEKTTLKWLGSIARHTFGPQLYILEDDNNDNIE